MVQQASHSTRCSSLLLKGAENVYCHSLLSQFADARYDPHGGNVQPGTVTRQLGTESSDLCHTFVRTSRRVRVRRGFARHQRVSDCQVAHLSCSVQNHVTLCNIAIYCNYRWHLNISQLFWRIVWPSSTLDKNYQKLQTILYKHLLWNRTSGYVWMVPGLFLSFQLFAVEEELAALHLRYPFMWLGTAPMPMKDTLSTCQQSGRIQQCMAMVAKLKPTHV